MIQDSLNIEFDDNNILSSLFGINDCNLRILEKFNEVKINYRGNNVKIIGNRISIEETRRTLLDLFEEAKKGVEIDEDKIIDTKNLLSLKIKNAKQLDLFIQTKKRKIIPRSNNQIKYFKLLNNKSIIFAVGPAGTGKTFLAVASAVKLYAENKIRKIVLTRPAVEAGERLGYLPGDLSQKIDPYLVPLFDALEHFFGNEKLGYLIEKRNIEIVPLAYMRGRTLDNACIILDEAQNATSNQIKMFLTRLGENSKIIITGDETQIDLYKKDYSGLRKTRKKLSNIDEISVMEFQNSDIVRNPIVSKILEVFPEK